MTFYQLPPGYNTMKNRAIREENQYGHMLPDTKKYFDEYNKMMDSINFDSENDEMESSDDEAYDDSKIYDDAISKGAND